MNPTNSKGSLFSLKKIILEENTLYDKCALHNHLKVNIRIKKPNNSEKAGGAHGNWFTCLSKLHQTTTMKTEMLYYTIESQ